MSRLAELGRAFRHELAVYRRILAHPRTPRSSKLLLGLAVGYALLPFDLIPDFLPVIGHLDDLVIVPALLWLALRRLPPDLVAACRREVLTDADSTQPSL